MLTKADLTRLRDLREKKAREAAGLYLVEGVKVINELLDAGQPLLEIFATPEWLDPRAGLPSVAGAPSPQVTAVTAAEMARISHFPTPSPVLALGRLVRVPLPPGDADHGLTLALDGIQDAGNVGTLLRIADWYAFDRVLLSPESADLFSQKVINASMGSFARVCVHTVSLAEALTGCAAPVLGCDLTGTSVHALPSRRDAVLVIGSEGRGLSPAVRQLVTEFVTIPQFGKAESLNAAIAAAIVCDNLRRVQSDWAAD